MRTQRHEYARYKLRYIVRKRLHACAESQYASMALDELERIDGRCVSALSFHFRAGKRLELRLKRRYVDM